MAKILFHIANFDFKAAFEVMKKGFKDTADTAKKDFTEIFVNMDIMGKKTLKRNLHNSIFGALQNVFIE